MATTWPPNPEERVRFPPPLPDAVAKWTKAIGCNPMIVGSNPTRASSVDRIAAIAVGRNPTVPNGAAQVRVLLNAPAQVVKW